jgi:hypothetical protein
MNNSTYLELLPQYRETLEIIKKQIIKYQEKIDLCPNKLSKQYDFIKEEFNDLKWMKSNLEYSIFWMEHGRSKDHKEI